MYKTNELNIKSHRRRDTIFCVSSSYVPTINIMTNSSFYVSINTNKYENEPKQHERDAKFCVSTTKNEPTEKFKNKYSITSSRLKNYDYSSNGAYFVTICTKNRKHFFGDIIDGKMQLSEIGEIANDCWNQITYHFPFVQLGEFIVMPNHVHGILIIDKTIDFTIAVETQNLASQYLASQYQTQRKIPRSNTDETQENKFGPQSQNLASIIRGFKIGVTKYVRNNTNVFEIWQSKFHDHIIRNENEFEIISDYIKNNPIKWQEDKYYE